MYFCKCNKWRVYYWIVRDYVYEWILHSHRHLSARCLHTHQHHSCINRSVHHRTFSSHQLQEPQRTYVSQAPLMHFANPVEGGRERGEGRYSGELVMVAVVGVCGGNYGWASGPWQTSLCPPGEHRAWLAAYLNLPVSVCRLHRWTASLAANTNL